MLEYFMEQERNTLKHYWCEEFSKEDCVFVESGRKAIEQGLRLLKSKSVALPSYTCERVLKAVLDAGCKPHVVDCNYDLQIDLNSLDTFKGDTVIVPHMFGIRVDIKKIKKMGYNVIEDCSQCLGLDGLGECSDVVVVSTGSTKWLPVGGGGLLLYDNCDNVKKLDDLDLLRKLNGMTQTIKDRLKKRKLFSIELLNAGVPLIGTDCDNAWMRAMYFTEKQKRVPYTPIHELYGNFKCPLVDGYKNKLDWISIFA